MKIVYVMVGLPGSGKSTWCNYTKSFFEDMSIDTMVFSSDKYREKLFGDENDQTHNSEVFNELYKDMTCFMSRDSSRVAFFDATNLTKKSRKEIFKRFSNFKEGEVKFIAVVMLTPKWLCIGRDAERRDEGKRFVGEDVINKMFNKFSFPSEEEGFSKLIYDQPFFAGGNDND